jgi:hypothetical protein
VPGAQGVEVPAHDGRSAVSALLDRAQQHLQLLGPVRGVAAVLQVRRSHEHGDTVDGDRRQDGHAPADARLRGAGGEPPEADVGEPDDRRVLEPCHRRDGVAVQRALVLGPGRLALLELVTQTEFDELDAEGVARPGVGGDGAGDVLVPGASHADVDLGEQAQLGAAGAQSSGQFDRSAPALDVPRRHPHPARQGFGGAGGPLVDLVEARQVLQQPAMEVFVAEPAGPALTVGPRRYVHPLSLSPGGPGASGAVTALP